MKKNIDNLAIFSGVPLFEKTLPTGRTVDKKTIDEITGFFAFINDGSGEIKKKLRPISANR
ncbi:MAG: hypothetical protein KAW12_15840 [Candidatus Aminicenantes bacterium]|nr:hypothetical protein [Candidatus Aminicenantes bacterium]